MLIGRADGSRSERRAYWVLVAALASTAMLGGSSGASVDSLLILRPLSIFFLAIGLWGLTRQHIRRYRSVFALAVAIFALVLVHLVPLPPLLWHRFAGHELLAQIDATAGLGAVWRPLTLVPFGGWNALFSLFMPLAVLVLAAQVTREQRFQLLVVVLVLSAISGLFGFFQILGPADGPLYLYENTNNGAAVGLFANRNHQAVLLACVFPMLAVYASAGVKSLEQARRRGLLAAGGGMILVPLILITGSRAGLLVGVAGLAAAGVFYKRPTVSAPAKRKAKRTDPRLIWAGFAVMLIGFLAVLMSRAEAIQRLLGTDELHGGRTAMWAVGWQMFWKYFPTGSGFGSIAEAYDIDEPLTMLEPAYTNHLHNDWLEVIVCGGLPAVLLLAIAIILWGRTAWKALRAPLDRSRDAVFARLGAIIMLMLALASIPDYPLRVPFLACLFVVAAMWLAGSGDSRHEKIP